MKDLLQRDILCLSVFCQFSLVALDAPCSMDMNKIITVVSFIIVLCGICSYHGNEGLYTIGCELY